MITSYTVPLCLKRKVYIPLEVTFDALNSDSNLYGLYAMAAVAAWKPMLYWWLEATPSAGPASLLK